MPLFVKTPMLIITPWHIMKIHNSIIPNYQDCCSLSLRQSSKAEFQSLKSSPHLSPTSFHVLALMIFSTLLSCLTVAASVSVLGSFGKNLPLYGSSLSFTTRSRALSLSTCLKTDSGSSGSGLVATEAQ